PAGALVRETEALLASLDDLETEPKAKTLGVKVPAEFEEKGNKLIRERVAKHWVCLAAVLSALDRRGTVADGAPTIILASANLLTITLRAKQRATRGAYGIAEQVAALKTGGVLRTSRPDVNPPLPDSRR
ncbi:MAG: hypothetical protein AAB422_05085, partial [Planctomycetota bacterium]